jgi:hypothetical protein
MTPDNDRLLFETESNISLEPSMVTIVPISFTLPAITYSELGIFHTIYQLLDAEGQTVQFDRESVTGRFAVYKSGTPYQPKEVYTVRVTRKHFFFLTFIL